MEPETTALITDPMGVFGFLAAIVAGVFWVSELPRCKKLFEVVPPVIYVYFLPMLATTAGITPSASPLYDWTVPYLLLFALLMLMVSVDVMSIVRLGGMALFMVAAGTVGVNPRGHPVRRDVPIDEFIAQLADEVESKAVDVGGSSDTAADVSAAVAAASD